MDILVLGGTAWLGREISRQALERGHGVTCLARGESGPAAYGANLIVADRTGLAAYDEVRRRDWGAVFEVTWQPGFARGALDALGERARHWTYISSGSVYSNHSVPDAMELRRPTAEDRVEQELYGEAKVACEQASADAVDDRLLIARCGLIGGPGDESGRTGYWVARSARDPGGPMLVPDTPDLPTQVVDVRDLASWLLDCAESGTTGTYDAVGPVVSFGRWVALSREVGGHTGPVVLAHPSWLVEQRVEQFMGEDSLAMWLVEPGWEAFQNRNPAAAIAAGLRHRSRTDLLADTLAWEREQGLFRPRRAGLTPPRERTLLTNLDLA